MNKHVLKSLLTSVVLLALAAGLSCYLFQDQLSAHLVRTTHIAVSKDTVKAASQRSAKHASYNFQAVKPLSLASLSSAALSKHAVAAVGKVLIPQVGINLPIALGVGNAELAFAAGTLNPNQRMGEANYALAGHHMAQDETVLFGPLVKTSVGMTAYITDMAKVYVYQIYARKYISATTVSILDPTPGPELTLVTCDDDGTGRLVVQAKQVATIPLAKTPTALQKLIAEN